MATVKFIQAQKFILSGSGSSIGDTTLSLQSMVGIDGNNIVTADIGTGGYGTIEPGNGTQEEAIVFTGITQNANGTATLTGVSTVLFKSPYTASSGLAKTHAGATTFILSNDAAFYGNILSYVDTALSSGAVPATTLVNGISKLSVAPVSAPSPVVVGDNDIRLSQYTVDTGSANAYAIAPSPAITAYAAGQIFRFKAVNASTTASTLNVNSLGTKAITKFGTTALIANDILANEIIQVQYDGTQFQVLSPTTATPSVKPTVTTFTGTGTWTKPAGLTYAIVEVVGGGGGGGGGTAASNGAAGGGGGGAGYTRKLFLTGALGATQAVTIGAAGSAGAVGGNGGAGGASSFSTLSGAGGNAGSGSSGSPAGGGSPGVGSGGDVNISGLGGGSGVCGSTASISASGAGGSSALGGGAQGVAGGSVAGQTGGNYGGGGSGGSASSGGGSQTGGAGAPGFVVVNEYYV